MQEDQAALQELQLLVKQWQARDHWFQPSRHRAQMEWNQIQTMDSASAFASLDARWTAQAENLLAECDSMLEELRLGAKPLLERAKQDASQAEKPGLALACLAVQTVEDIQQTAAQEYMVVNQQKSQLSALQKYWLDETLYLLDILDSSQGYQEEAKQVLQQGLEKLENCNPQGFLLALKNIHSSSQALAEAYKSAQEDEKLLTMQQLPVETLHSYQASRERSQRLQMISRCLGL